MSKNTAEIDEFYDLLLVRPLSAGQIALWHALNFIHNKCNQEWFTVANQTLQLFSGLKSRQSIVENRNVLKQLGLIDFKSQGTKATFYRVINTSCLSNGQDNIQASRQDGLQVSRQKSCSLINKIKINNLFNYLKDKEAKNFEGISSVDKTAIINVLKQLEIYVDQTAESLVPTKVLEDTKVQYWCVKELYFSSFKVYLNEMEREFFINKYLRTLENLKITEITDDNLDDIIRYFIKTLKKEYEKI